jgi:ribosomal protein L17
MLDPDSIEYFRRRELAERTAAKSATTIAARGLHQELAQNYADLLRTGGLTRISKIRR